MCISLRMNPLGITVVLVLLVGAWAQVTFLRPECDSPEAEEAALVAQDYLNAQHTHGYKYALNRIEDIKIYSTPMGNITYDLEIELLETDCHVLDPTPLANCTVRPKALTAVEGDCDVVLTTVDGALAVTAFKCKTEESTEDICLGCPTLLPLNDTAALDFVHASLVTVNNFTVNGTYIILEVGRMLSQVFPGGPIYSAEYVITEAYCTNDNCVPLINDMAARGICFAKGRNADHTVDCRMFATMMPFVDANSTATAATALPPAVHGHTGSLSAKHGLRFHKLTALHDPQLSGLLSASESDEIILVAPAVINVVADPVAAPTAADPAPTAADPSTDPAAAAVLADDIISVSDASSSKEVPSVLFKRDVVAASAPATKTDTFILVPVCPGRIRFF
ncbi:alpha-2-HS-glycoprotein 2 [Labrus mixtus]|uniref:alpha-2-HS-glycoprotein 2 n=1 Tax=Labrus mixtus TaxID=508554 RepID=UPI0029C0BF49|nr:alpha-2-HS-glycoprotein 2 [Labrus mixtus]